jgi:hypothetical protein
LEKGEVDGVREEEEDAAMREKSSSPTEDEEEDDEGEPRLISLWMNGCGFVGGVSGGLEAKVVDEAAFAFAGGVKYTHVSLRKRHVRQEGLSSLHLTLRVLQFLQPARDFL